MFLLNSRPNFGGTTSVIETTKVSSFSIYHSLNKVVFVGDVRCSRRRFQIMDTPDCRKRFAFSRASVSFHEKFDSKPLRVRNPLLRVSLRQIKFLLSRDGITSQHDKSAETVGFRFFCVIGTPPALGLLWRLKF